MTEAGAEETETGTGTPSRLNRLGREQGPGRLVAASWILLWVAAFLMGPASTLRADWTPAAISDLGPREVVETIVDQVLETLSDESLDQKARRGRIEAIAFDAFDFTTMSKLTLARNWKKLDTDQKRRFVRDFKSHLSRIYGSRLDRYRQEDVEFMGTREEPRGDVTVKTKIVGGQFDGIEMNYRMRHRKERWRAIDVVIEGVSLIANFRSQFAEVISNGGIEQLLEDLRSKNFDAPGLDDNDNDNDSDDEARSKGGTGPGESESVKEAS